MTIAWLLPLVVVASAILTGGLRRYALAHQVLDIPNDRSSHTTPVPRGGGLAIVVTFLGAVAWLGAGDRIDRRLTIALLGAGLLVAAVGFLDDHRSIAVRWRLSLHVVAAAWALAWLGGMPPVGIAGAVVLAGWWGDVFAACYMAWLLNLYNFMDGIDGLAGLEAVTVGLGAALIVRLSPLPDAEIVLPTLLAGAACGFLIWNWPPATIFMGDVGSGFLGLMLAILSLRAAWARPELFWSWTILLGVFVVDASVTLARRLIRGEKPYEAHRLHAYQHAARLMRSHRPVVLTVAAVNLLWLLPIAAIVAAGRLSGVAGVSIAYAPLLWLGIRFHAGTPGPSPIRAAGTIG